MLLFLNNCIIVLELEQVYLSVHACIRQQNKNANKNFFKLNTLARPQDQILVK